MSQPKDHEVAEFINQLRDAAREFGTSQQLRERLKGVVMPLVDRMRADSDSRRNRFQDNFVDRFFDHLHQVAGYCGHCGKRDCAGRASDSRLPAEVDLAHVVAAIEAAKCL